MMMITVTVMMIVIMTITWCSEISEPIIAGSIRFWGENQLTFNRSYFSDGDDDDDERELP